ncbi:MAG: glycosyltransferase family 4 protein [Anaerolineae bacterium]|nr:glycosyltransferase family 4 protein [Anaerolineae bacterium]
MTKAQSSIPAGDHFAEKIKGRMRILVVAPGFLPSIGGAEIGIHEIYRRLGQRHDVYILTPDLGPRQPAEGFDNSGYTILYYKDFLDLKKIRGKMIMQGIIPPFSIGTVVAIHKQIAALQPDVVNTHFAASTGLAAVWAQKIGRVPTVLSLIGRDAVPGPLVPRLWPWYSRLVAKNVQHTIFITHFCRSYRLHDNFSWSVIPYGADIQAIQPQADGTKLRSTLGLPPNVSVLFSLQRLHPIKRVDILIECVKCLVDRGVDDFVLLLGGKGSEAAKLNALVEKLGIQAYVSFLGYVSEDQVSDYFALADIFVFSSVFETFGIVLVQAMAAGIPIVAVDNSAIPEVVEDQVTGLLSPSLDPNLLADRVQQLLENRALRVEMGQRARENAEKLYDWDKIALQYEQTLTEVVVQSENVQAR